MASKTLDELEGVTWGEPPLQTHLVTTCHRLRRKPIDQFTTEDLRIMIGQEIGLRYLVPRALEVLEREPLAEGDYYPGDLLVAVTEAADWLSNERLLLDRVIEVTNRAIGEPTSDDELRSRLAAFLGQVRT